MSNDPEDVTRLLQRWRNGDAEAEARLFEVLLPDLRRMARRQFRQQRDGHTLQPTALVNEAFLRMRAAKQLEFKDRGHFFAIAGRIMRRHLIDRARTRPAVEPRQVDDIAENLPAKAGGLELITAMDALLDNLGRESPRQRSVVEAKFFVGLTDEEAADALGLTLHTLQREWHRARRWLFERLNAEPCKGERKPTTA
jgi:RNA polymerase sigma factor (TIGR02999 family)